MYIFIEMIIFLSIFTLQNPFYINLSYKVTKSYWQYHSSKAGQLFLKFLDLIDKRNQNELELTFGLSLLKEADHFFHHMSKYQNIYFFTKRYVSFLVSFINMQMYTTQSWMVLSRISSISSWGLGSCRMQKRLRKGKNFYIDTFMQIRITDMLEWISKSYGLKQDSKWLVKSDFSLFFMNPLMFERLRLTFIAY